MKIGINGFGRIGRAILRAIVEGGHDMDIVQINDPGNPETLCHLLKYDSVHGRFDQSVALEDGHLICGNRRIRLSRQRDPQLVDWQGVDWVMESTGKLLDRQSLQTHMQQGAGRVLVSAPAGENADITVVYGVNHDQINSNHRIISNASCTTNCMAPVIKVLHDNFEVLDGAMVTVHAYTNDQMLVDNSHKDLRRSRAAALSIIPTKTGAARAIGLVIPELAGKLDGYALRVPVANVSMVDLTVRLQAMPTLESIHEVLEGAASGALQGVMDVCHEPLVSIDYNHNSHSVVVDGLETKKIGQLYKFALWYDNEWGFVNRMLDVVKYANG